MKISIKKNITWNLMSNVLPFIAGIIFFPLIIKAYGNERFGILTLAWALVGYFGLFDLGLSRALTQIISEKISEKLSKAKIAQLIHTGFYLMWALGALGGFILFAISPFIANQFLKAPSNLYEESIVAFSYLAVSIPIVVHSSAMRGVLEALHLFKSSSLIRMIIGVGTFAVPYFASLFGATLPHAILGLIGTRMMGWIFYWIAIRKTKILKPETKKLHKVWLKPLFSFGGWITLSNLIGPLMVYTDRFVIMALLGAGSVAYYVAPYEVITKMWAIPAAISGVLFPVFAKTYKNNIHQTSVLLKNGLHYLLMLIYPLILFAVLFAKEWMSFWLDSDFAAHGNYVVCWLSLGILLNSYAQIIYANIQGSGRADWTAKLHIVEVLPYLVILFFSLKHWGINGAAFAWFIRSLIDLLGLVFLSARLSKSYKKAMYVSLTVMSFGMLPLVTSLIDLSLYYRTLLCLATLFIYGVLSVYQLKKDKLFNYLSYEMKSR